MIKINSLSINNYVYYNNEHNEIGVITEIKTSINPNIDYIGLNNRVDIYYQLKHIKGIPISEEWLLKFLFKKSHHDWFYKSIICTSNYQNEFNICLRTGKITIDNGYNETSIININFIHELQNLYFYLTNQNLIFKKK